MKQDLMKGVIDMHVHTNPDLRLRAYDDFELMEAAIRVGARAIVIKTHQGTTMDRAYLCNRHNEIVHGNTNNFTMYGSITLNRVVGGINPKAVDTALRLGAEVHIVYRRSEAELPARAEEVHHAKEEGIIFDLLTNPKEILVDENGHVKGMKVVKMELGEPDASGRRRPVEIPGSEYDMDVDTVIMSLGTSPNPLISSTTKGLEVNKRRCIIAEEETGKTSKDGVYAGGDAVTGAATVILAMGAGKAGAKGIDEYLKNK